MVQKKWTGLSLIAASLLLSGCYKVFASPASLKAVEREVEAVEEELGDASEKSVSRRASLKKQLVGIKRVNRERKLFFGVLERQMAALTEDMVQVFDDLARTSTSLRSTKKVATKEMEQLDKDRAKAQKEWTKHKKQARRHLCEAKPEHAQCKEVE